MMTPPRNLIGEQLRLFYDRRRLNVIRTGEVAGGATATVGSADQVGIRRRAQDARLAAAAVARQQDATIDAAVTMAVRCFIGFPSQQFRKW